MPHGLGGAILAFFAGVSRELTAYLSGGKPLIFGRLLARGTVAVVSGLTIGHVAVAFGKPDWENAATALGGYWGPASMSFLVNYFKNHFKP